MFQLFLHIGFNQVHRHMTRPFNNSLDIMFPGNFSQFSKGFQFSWDWHDMWQEVHGSQFTVAKVTKAVAARVILANEAKLWGPMLVFIAQLFCIPYANCSFEAVSLGNAGKSALG